ncbi:MAG: hypothetical protein ACK45B_06095 [Limisphaerales bacterium]
MRFRAGFIWCVALFGLGVLAASCERKAPPSDLAFGEMDRVLAIYCGDDIYAAEQSLLAYREKLNKAEAEGVKGIRFDAARGIVNARLFLIYVHQGSPKADEMYPDLVEHFNRERIYGGLSPTNFTREILIQGIEMFDRNLDVKWKRSLPE